MLDLKDVRKELEENKAILIDVRSQEEWDSGALTGAQHFSLQNLLKGELPEFLDRNKKLYVYCQRGVRARKAQAILSKSHEKTFALTQDFEELQEVL